MFGFTDEKFESLVREALKCASGLITLRCVSDDPRQNLPHHNVPHTEEVTERAVRIARMMCTSEREIALAGIAGAFHDTIQEWCILDGGDGMSLERVRSSGKNEALSAAEAVRFMASCEFMAACKFKFKPVEYGYVTQAIMATIVQMDKKTDVLVQPLLVKDVHPVVAAVALADLGSAGLDAEAFIRDGREIFLENNVDIAIALHRANTAADIEPACQEAYRKRLVSWLRDQYKFATDRMEMLSYDIACLHPFYRPAVRRMFNGFRESRKQTEVCVLAAETLQFTHLMRWLRPGTFPGGS